MESHRRISQLSLGVILVSLVPAIVAAQATVAQQVSMAKELIPSLRAITVVCNVDEVQPVLRELKSATTGQGLGLTVWDVKNFAELRKAFLPFSNRSVDLIWMVPDSISTDKFGRRFLNENCIQKKIPLYSLSKETLREGALFYFTFENGQPVYFFNKAVAGLIGFTPPAAMASKLTPVE